MATLTRKRCPNGSRKNRKTGICAKKNTTPKKATPKKATPKKAIPKKAVPKKAVPMKIMTPIKIMTPEHGPFSTPLSVRNRKALLNQIRSRKNKVVTNYTPQMRRQIDEINLMQTKNRYVLKLERIEQLKNRLREEDKKILKKVEEEIKEDQLSKPSQRWIDVMFDFFSQMHPNPYSGKDFESPELPKPVSLF